MLTNFELKRLKPKLDIVEKPENRVHELTDSNGALTISHQHAPSGRRRSRRTGETFQTRKIDPNWQNCC